MHRSRGYSVIELLGAIGIMGIVSIIGYPRLDTVMTHYRFDNASRTLLAEINKTRLRAIAEGVCFRMVFDSTSKTYEVQKLTDGPCTSAGTFTAEVTRPFVDDGSVSVSATANPIFTPRGMLVETTDSVVTLTHSRGARRVLGVARMGRIYVRG